MSYSKNYICKFMQTNSWHKLFHFHLSLWIWKVWKGRKKIQNCEYLENEKGFLDKIKTIFHSFWRTIIWRKNKNLIKIAGTSFKNPNHALFKDPVVIMKEIMSWLLKDPINCGLAQFDHDQSNSKKWPKGRNVKQFFQNHI